MVKDESILNSIKDYVDVVEDDDSFNKKLITDINTVLMTVMHEWHGVDHAFVIHDETAIWSDFLGDDVDYEGVKTLVGLKVKLLFDPPTNAAVLQSYKEEIYNLEVGMYIWKDNTRLD